MQNTSKNAFQSQRSIRKQGERGPPNDTISPEKIQPCLQNKQRSGPEKDITFGVPRTFEQRSFAVIVPSTNDILCGRGKAFFKHEGNKRFRDTIDKYINAYIKVSQRSKRSEIVKAVVNETFGTGARFLKKSENKLEWYDGGKKLAKEKVRALDFIHLKSHLQKW